MELKVTGVITAKTISPLNFWSYLKQKNFYWFLWWFLRSFLNEAPYLVAMGWKCSAPGCRQGYSNFTGTKRAIFKCPGNSVQQWKRAIPKRWGQQKIIYLYMCEDQFHSDDIIRTTFLFIFLLKESQDNCFFFFYFHVRGCDRTKLNLMRTTISTFSCLTFSDVLLDRTKAVASYARMMISM